LITNKFLLAGMAANIDTSLFKVCPDVLGSAILDSAKRHARFFEKTCPDIGHRKMLEKIADVAGFPNWHAFQTLAIKLTKVYAPPMRGSRPSAPSSVFEPFAPSVPLLIRVGDDLPPKSGELNAMKEFGNRLSVKLNTSYEEVMDVLAQLQGADTLAALIERTPVKSKSPFYRFVTYEDGNGRFDATAACWASVDELDALWQSYDDRTKEEKKLARKFLVSTLEKRPDFLEGWLALATIEKLDGNEDKAGPIFEAAIKKANDLIPKTFKGSIEWGYIDNRFYHRLLYNYMRWLADRSIFSKAIPLARKQLRLNPPDNLGVRFDLPCLLAANGQHESASVAMRRLERKDARTDAHPLLVLSICNLAARKEDDGIAYFIRALFEFPALRPIILDNTIPNLDENKWHRGVIPSVEDMWFDYYIVAEKHGIVAFILKEILQDPRTVQGEQHADKLYQETRSKLHSVHDSSATMAPWHDGSKKMANELMRQLQAEPQV